MSDPAHKVEQMITPVAADMGYDIIRVSYGGGRRPVLQIMAERSTDGSMSVLDCEKLSREISALMDVEDPISGEYVLEVSSPGVDRPLTRAKDFQRWLGFDVKIEMQNLVADRRRFKGKLLAFDGATITVETDEDTVELPFDELAKAKLLMTDNLLDAMQKLKEQNQPSNDTDAAAASQPE